MRYLILLIFSFLLTGCGVYSVSTKPKIKITKILTLTSTGDTIAVPIREFQKYNFDSYDFNRFNFYGGYYWNSWQYPYNHWNGVYRPNGP